MLYPARSVMSAVARKAQDEQEVTGHILSAHRTQRAGSGARLCHIKARLCLLNIP